MIQQEKSVGTAMPRPTRREERRAQTVREIKNLAMNQISAGGPDAVSLSGIVREMSMSPAAVYRYFANRDALLADLVVDSYTELADSLAVIERSEASSIAHVRSILVGMRAWALAHPNAYRLIFQTSVGSGQDFAAERTVAASQRSMGILVDALASAAESEDPAAATVPFGSAGAPELHEPVASALHRGLDEVHRDEEEVGGVDETDGVESPSSANSELSELSELSESIGRWAERSGLTGVSTEVLTLALLTWTRLHGIISLELGGHLGSTGVDPAALFDAEIAGISRQVVLLRRPR